MIMLLILLVLESTACTQAQGDGYKVMAYEGPGVTFGTFHSNGYTVIDKYAKNLSQVDAVLRHQTDQRFECLQAEPWK